MRVRGPSHSTSSTSLPHADLEPPADHRHQKLMTQQGGADVGGGVVLRPTVVRVGAVPRNQSLNRPGQVVEQA